MEEQNQHNSEEQQNKDNEHSTFVALLTTISIFILLIFIFDRFLGVLCIITLIGVLLFYYFAKYIEKTFGEQMLRIIGLVLFILLVFFVLRVLSNICPVCGH